MRGCQSPGRTGHPGPGRGVHRAAAGPAAVQRDHAGLAGPAGRVRRDSGLHLRAARHVGGRGDPAAGGSGADPARRRGAAADLPQHRPDDGQPAGTGLGGAAAFLCRFGTYPEAYLRRVRLERARQELAGRRPASSARRSRSSPRSRARRPRCRRPAAGRPAPSGPAAAAASAGRPGRARRRGWPAAASAPPGPPASCPPARRRRWRPEPRLGRAQVGERAAERDGRVGRGFRRADGASRVERPQPEHVLEQRGLAHVLARERGRPARADQGQLRQQAGQGRCGRPEHPAPARSAPVSAGSCQPRPPRRSTRCPAGRWWPGRAAPASAASSSCRPTKTGLTRFAPHAN